MRQSLCCLESLEAMVPNSSEAILVHAGEGRTLRAFGHAVVMVLEGKHTSDKLTCFLNVTPPGAGPGLHYHDREDRDNA
jgi:hypothetical protein